MTLTERLLHRIRVQLINLTTDELCDVYGHSILTIRLLQAEQFLTKRGNY